MKRGSVVIVALQGDYGKPRPALIVQADMFSSLPSVTILPITSDLRFTPIYRVTIEPTPENGLRKPSQIMIDKPQAIAREKVGQVVGHLEDETMMAVSQSLALFLGFA